MSAVGFDWSQDISENALVLAGVMYMAYLILNIKPMGLAHFAPQCSSWLAMCRGHTGRRCGDLAGNTERNDVHEANVIAMVVFLDLLVQSLFDCFGRNQFGNVCD